jgi:YVTN family beta-propeller protein
VGVSSTFARSPFGNLPFRAAITPTVCLGLSLLMVVPGGLSVTAHPPRTSSLIHADQQSSTPERPAAEGLRYSGATSLGPPGYSSLGIVFDNRTNQTFVSLSGSYLAVLSGSPLAIVGTIALGTNASPDNDLLGAIAFDWKDNTIFVDESPDMVAVVSAASWQVVANTTLGYLPTSLAYDPETGNVYGLDLGGSATNLTVINASTYAVTLLPVVDGPEDYQVLPYALTYDSVTQDLVMIGSETCLCFWTNGWVSAIDPTTGETVWMRSTPQFQSYDGLTFDGISGRVALLLSNETLLILNGTNGWIVSQPTLPGNPGCDPLWAAMAYDERSADIVVGECNRAIETFNTSSDSAGPSVSVLGSPAAIAVDPRSGDVEVANWDTDTVSVLPPDCSAILSILSVGGAPNGVAIDSATGTAYVLGTDNVSVLNVATHRLVRSIGVGVTTTYEPGSSLQAILFDVRSDEIFVANVGSGTVSVISTSSNLVIATIAVNDYPVALAWNNETNQVYVACANTTIPQVGSPSVLDVISAASLSVVARISLGAVTPAGIAYDPSSNEIFVSNSAMQVSPPPPELLIISAASNQTIGSIALPSSAWTLGEVVFDNFTGDLYVAGAGLTNYYDTLGDFVVNPTTRTLVGNISLGVDPNGIAPVPDSVWLVATVAGDNTVDLIDTATGEVVTSATLASGTVPMGVVYDPASDQIVVADSGNDSASYLVTGEFYPVTFSESGLPAALNWTVALNGQPESILTNGGTDTVAFDEPNGSYSFSIVGIPSWHQDILPYNGSLAVGGAPVAEPMLVFSQVVYPVTFSESGLPSGTNWTLTLGSRMSWSTSDSMPFTSSNGTIPFTVGPVAGYSANVSHASIAVHGSPVSVTIEFRPKTAASAPASGFPPLAEYALLGGMVIGVALGLTILLRSRPRK